MSLLLVVIFFLPLNSLFSQHTSRDNYTGDWEIPSSWDPDWALPQSIISGYNITINGYITVSSSLGFTGAANNLIINDTLVILGNLTVNNNNQILINDGGILIVRGMLTMENQSAVVANGYFVITGNLNKTSAIGQGSFTSNDGKPKVFIGGSVTPSALTADKPNFPALNCSTPAIPYANSSCSYGNTTDLMVDPIYLFFQTTCPAATASGNSPVCTGSAISLTSSEGATYSWTGPASFTSNMQNPSIPAASESMEGTYSVIVTNPDGCTSTASTSVIINPVPSVSSSATGNVCSGSEFLYDITSSLPGTTNTWSRASVTGINNSSISGQTTDPINEILVNTMQAPLNVIYLITPTANGCIGQEFSCTVTVNPVPLAVITNPAPVCSPAKIDLTGDEVTAGSQSGLVFTYWTDQAATVPYMTPDSADAGTYYIKSTDPLTTCFKIDSADVIINPLPEIIVTDPAPVCSPETVDLTASQITAGSSPELTWSYWSDSDATIACTAPTTATAGTYYIMGSTPAGCYGIKPVTVTVNPLPVLNFTSTSDPICVNEKRPLAANPAGGTFSIEEGPGSISGNIFTATGPGIVKIAYTYTDICTNKAVQQIEADEPPVPIPGPDQELEYVFETQMVAELSDNQTGEWMLISGAGQISDIFSPVAKITGLMIGENVFNWKVQSGSCEASADMMITVNDLFVPSVITPNGDGKNDLFKINALNGRIELIIINRWGNTEYTDNSYNNDWDGRSGNGTELKDDTYYYIIKFENGLVKKGTVLITR